VNSGWVRNAVDLVLERRKLSRREVVDAVFGPDAGNAPTPPATWTPGGGELAGSCLNRGHVYAAGDDSCVYCNGVN
jgi:hypothetical protein